MTKNTDTFARILGVFHVGSLRLGESELATLRLSVAVVSHHTGEEDAPSRGASEAVQQLDAIRPSSWDAFNYVSHLSHLIYATTLLDTFLTDTTQFLFMLFPGSLGKEARISIEDVLNTGSRSELLTHAAIRKAREISYSAFVDRLSELQRRFGLDFELDQNDVSSLEHFSTLRNVAVHDQGFLSMSLAEDGTVQVARRTCPRHPTSISTEDVRTAIHSYRRVVRVLSVAVLTQVLKDPDHELASQLIGFLQDGPLGALGAPDGQAG